MQRRIITSAGSGCMVVASPVPPHNFRLGMLWVDLDGRQPVLKMCVQLRPCVWLKVV